MLLVSLGERDKQELEEVLHGLAVKLHENNLHDMAACVTDGHGREYTVLTGRYRRDTGAASRAGFLLQFRAMAAANEDNFM